MQHFIHHLSPKGTAGFVLANGAMSSQSSGEGDIRKAIVNAGLVDCIIALPGQLFFNTGIPSTLWFISRDRANRSDKTLFIDAREMGEMINRRNKKLTDEEIASIAEKYKQFKKQDGSYEDESGFVKVATTEEIEKNDFVLTPGRYVGSVDLEVDEEVFEEKMSRLTVELSSQFKESVRLEDEIKLNLTKEIWAFCHNK